MKLGAVPDKHGTRFAVWSGAAERIWVSLFDESGEREVARHALSRGEDGVFALHLPGVGNGARYGFRADGLYDPAAGLWFDPAKLLTDPYALTIDRTYRYDPRLGARREEAIDTASLLPKSIVTELPSPCEPHPPVFKPGGLIYELNVRGFTMQHPDVPSAKRGTIAALAESVVIEHLVKLGVSAVELMPVHAWIDERHLPPLGLSNAWGYNPVSYFALDPRLAPGGLTELRDTVAALREAGIGTILDVVFNHTGESDEQGPTLSLRGLDARTYFRHGPDGRLVNDTGTGNTLACDQPVVQQLVLDALRHFVLYAGVDGYRFDLAPILGRNAHGFSPKAALLETMRQDPVLADRVLIAEPWDIGPEGYQLGRFAAPFLEWNDRYRDDVRRFWRGDGSLADLATRLSGSSDIFARADRPNTRTINFIAAHDGMTLADLTAYTHKHNAANGEDNRDGHNDNLSWNHGVEGQSDDPAIQNVRRCDLKALLGTLFASIGTIMLTAGDEFGRTQRGNNNAYAQDNEISWLDWSHADAELLAHARNLTRFRRLFIEPDAAAFLNDADANWQRPDGEAFTEADWHDEQNRQLALIRRTDAGRIAILINGADQPCAFALPAHGELVWRAVDGTKTEDGRMTCPARSVVLAAQIGASETPY
ncbi:glycogen debranching protein GlgX [Tianweitania sp. BSSL-BM11]|uniref:Glycogen debranching protein GlgX n=1 Tax=Tianweitania aestuarii TaxID=2814886 RepID=A0ABS5RU18_9HYPH|nr:glycogen debranching protein GlgX [Tianweitania aestuarii]MBS9719822.1 glycogen debranching protein GlgX [Tianweitania aestuarii]